MMELSAAAKAHSRVIVGEIAAAFVGRALPLRPHRKSVRTMAFGLEGPFVVETFDRDLAMSASAAARFAQIEPGQLHRIRANGQMLFLYVDAALGFERLDKAAGEAAAEDIGRLFLSDVAAGVLLSEALNCLGLHGRRVSEPRLTPVLEALRRRPDRIRTVQEAAALAGLSGSHLQRLLRQSHGVAFRPYRAWRRMALVMRALRTGSTLTDAAFAAGFASSAHLSESFRQMFGVSLSTLLGAGVTIDVLDEPPKASAGAHNPATAFGR